MHGSDQLLRSGPLEQKARGAGTQRTENVVVLLKGRQDQDPGFGCCIEQETGRRDAVEIGHAYIHQDDVWDPPLLLADEPTGNLDSTTADAVLALFGELNAEGRTIVVVTHERNIRSIVDREVTLKDGRIITDKTASAPVLA